MFALIDDNFKNGRGTIPGFESCGIVGEYPTLAEARSLSGRERFEVPYRIVECEVDPWGTGRIVGAREVE